MQSLGKVKDSRDIVKQDVFLAFKGLVNYAVDALASVVLYE